MLILLSKNHFLPASICAWGHCLAGKPIGAQYYLQHKVTSLYLKILQLVAAVIVSTINLTMLILTIGEILVFVRVFPFAVYILLHFLSFSEDISTCRLFFDTTISFFEGVLFILHTERYTVVFCPF